MHLRIWNWWIEAYSCTSIFRKTFRSTGMCDIWVFTYPPRYFRKSCMMNVIKGKMLSPQKEHLSVCVVSPQDSSSSGRGHLWGRLPTETIFFMPRVGPQRENTARLRQRRWNSRSKSNILAWGEIRRGLTDVHKWKQRANLCSGNETKDSQWQMERAVLLKRPFKGWAQSASKNSYMYICYVGSWKEFAREGSFTK